MVCGTTKALHVAPGLSIIVGACFHRSCLVHDGYLFTLGVSGTPQGDRPATQLLLAMMAALPPVKRVADLRDAELLLLATPAVADGVPHRVAQLLDALATNGTALRGKVAGLIAVGEAPYTRIALDALQRFCRQVGLDVAAARQYPLIVDAGILADAAAAARQAYRVAAERLPVPSLAKLDG
jgi:hypothetical protein